MAIEVEVSGTPQEVKREYPYLGRHANGTVVFFTGRNTGVSLIAGTNDYVGDYDMDWNEGGFTPLYPSETITLRNK